MRHIICDRHVFWISFDIPKESAYHYLIESSFFTTPKRSSTFTKQWYSRKTNLGEHFANFGFVLNPTNFFQFCNVKLKKNGKLRLFTSELLLMVVVKRNQELTNLLSLKISIQKPFIQKLNSFDLLVLWCCHFVYSAIKIPAFKLDMLRNVIKWNLRWIPPSKKWWSVCNAKRCPNQKMGFLFKWMMWFAAWKRRL